MWKIFITFTSKSILLNNVPDAAVCSQFYSTDSLFYMFRAFYKPIIRIIISTVSTASGTNHGIVSATFFQRGLTIPSFVPEVVDIVEIVLLMMGV